MNFSTQVQHIFRANLLQCNQSQRIVRSNLRSDASVVGFFNVNKHYCCYAVFSAETNSFRLSNLEYKLYFRRQAISRCIPFIHMRHLAIKTMTFRMATINFKF